MNGNPDFWLACRHLLLDCGPAGGLVVIDEFLKALLARPEIVPAPEAHSSSRPGSADWRRLVKS